MNLRRFTSTLVILLIVSQPIGAQEPEDILLSIKAGELFEINKILASPEMEGRLSGTGGYNKAARWAASKFEEWDLKPVYGKNFLQPFNVGYNETRQISFSLVLPPQGGTKASKRVRMELFKDFGFTLYSGFGGVEAEVVFVGFGITAPKLGWDDYANVDVKGKVVAFLSGGPQIDGKDFSEYTSRQPKMDNADRHGAAGLIQLGMAVVSGLGKYMERLPMVMAGDDVAQMLFSPKGYDVATIKTLLRDGHSLSFATGVKARINVVGRHHPNSETYNVVGMIEGSDPKLREEYLVFGGHLDHLGPWPVLLPGASDNASGSAVVMGLAHAFSKLTERPKRSIVFALFGAEELGLLGSKHMAANLPGFPSKPILMSNHDMNGVGNSLHVAGGKTYPELYRLIQRVNTKYSINNRISAGEISPIGGNSDYAPFLEIGIPAYSNWVRGGQRYGVHTPEDTIYVITPKMMEDVVRLYFMAGYLFANE